MRLINGEGNALLDADVYYIYGDETGEYGRAYLHLKNVLGASLNIKVYSDIAELADTVQALISGAGGAEAQTYAGLGGLDTGALISGILSLDFGSVIKEVTANGSVIGATLNADGVLAMLGIDLSLGDISLEYAPGEDGGRLTGSMPALGLEAGIFGSGEPSPSAPEGYLEAHRAIELVQSAAAIFRRRNGGQLRHRRRAAQHKRRFARPRRQGAPSAGRTAALSTTSPSISCSTRRRAAQRTARPPNLNLPIPRPQTAVTK